MHKTVKRPEHYSEFHFIKENRSLTSYNLNVEEGNGNHTRKNRVLCKLCIEDGLDKIQIGSCCAINGSINQ